MDEVKVINVENEIMGLQYYIEAMQKHEQRKNTLEDLGNLMIHVNNLKAWAGINDTEQLSNCNKPAVSKCDGIEREASVCQYKNVCKNDFVNDKCLADTEKECDCLILEN